VDISLRNSVTIEQVYSTPTFWNWENSRYDNLQVAKHIRCDPHSRKWNNSKLVQLPQLFDLKCQVLIFALIFCSCSLYIVVQWKCYVDECSFLIWSVNVMSCPLTGCDPNRICSCHFTVRPAAHICNKGIIMVFIILLWNSQLRRAEKMQSSVIKKGVYVVISVL
jgi:hypothetical protein